MENGYIAVVGGANLDLNGTPFTAMLGGDSNPGTVSGAPGGVGRNIAEVLAHMGADVRLVTALGNDMAAQLIRQSCAELGIDLSHSLTLAGERTGTYLCLNHPDGDLYAAVSDMRIYDRMTPELLAPALEMLNRASLVVLDANLPSPLLGWLAASCTAPLAADPVSAKKSVRLQPCLSHLLTLKPNRAEAAALTGIPIRDTEDLSRAADDLLRAGVAHVFISLGAEGVYYADTEARGIQPCCPAHIVNTSGCGDAFLAAASLALISGNGIKEAALLGQAASAICAEQEAAGGAELHMTNIRRRAGMTT